MTTATQPMPGVPPVVVPVTPDDLLTMGEKGLFELVDGELVEKPMGALSGETTILISNRLYPFVKAGRLGKLYSETAFRCFPNKPNQVRRPDIAFVTTSRLSLVPDAGHVPVRPDLAIEVVSPDDGVYDLDGKLRDYRAAGVPLVWVVNPAQDIRIVRVYRPGGPIDELGEADTLGGEDVLPGFAIAVRDLFPEPASGE